MAESGGLMGYVQTPTKARATALDTTSPRTQTLHASKRKGYGLRAMPRTDWPLILTAQSVWLLTLISNWGIIAPQYYWSGWCSYATTPPYKAQDPLPENLGSWHGCIIRCT